MNLIASILLLCALLPLPYGFYTFLRLFITLAGGVNAYNIYQDSSNNFLFWLFVNISILYNPIIPVHLDRGTWMMINIITAVVFLANTKS